MEQVDAQQKALVRLHKLEGHIAHNRELSLQRNDVNGEKEKKKRDNKYLILIHSIIFRSQS